MTKFPAAPEEITSALATRPSNHRAIRFRGHQWQSTIEDVGIEGLDLAPLNGTIRRDEMTDLVHYALRDLSELGAQERRHRVAKAFVLTMVWGYGSAGYGPYRTQRVLTGGDDKDVLDDTVLEKLSASIPEIRAGAHEGFWHLNNNSAGACKHLGPSFFTKWMYAVSAQGESRALKALPILDEITRGYVNGVDGVQQISPRNTQGYEYYVALLTHWAGEKHSAVEVEEAIFDVALGYHAAPRSHNIDPAAVFSRN